VPFLKPLSSYNHVKKCSPVSGVQSSVTILIFSQTVKGNSSDANEAAASFDAICFFDDTCPDKTGTSTKKGGGKGHAEKENCDEAEDKATQDATDLAKKDALSKAKGAVVIPECDKGCEPFGPIAYSEAYLPANCQVDDSYHTIGFPPEVPPKCGVTVRCTVEITLTATRRCISAKACPELF